MTARTYLNCGELLWILFHSRGHFSISYEIDYSQ